MSRELKFRAWVIAKHCYMEVVSIEFSTNKVILKGIWNKANNAPTMKAVPLDKVILEQYTGLKDKSGKEIYEGDIVKRSEDGGFEIVGVVEWSEKAARFWVNRYYYPNGKKWEVIGNIHENPELLEEAS